MDRKIVVVSGGFDPLHSGHIAMFEAARKLGDKLVVAVNSDDWLERKKGRAFMPWDERARTVSSLHCVDEVIAFNDDNGSATDALSKVLDFYHTDMVIFANGGDRGKDNIPEMSLENPRLSFEFSIGGDDKRNSSSWILKEWKSPKTERQWGYYRVLHEDHSYNLDSFVGLDTKVKELTVKPGASLSMQQHEHRAEFWIVADGVATVDISHASPHDYGTQTLGVHESIYIPTKTWHRLSNNSDRELRVVEIQYGDGCYEEDIKRVSI